MTETTNEKISRHAHINKQSLQAAQLLWLLRLRAPKLVEGIVNETPASRILWRLVENLLVGQGLFWAVDRLSFDPTSGLPLDYPPGGSRHYNSSCCDSRHRVLVRWHAFCWALQPLADYRIQTLYEVKWLTEDDNKFVVSRVVQPIKVLLESSNLSEVEAELLRNHSFRYQAEVGEGVVYLEGCLCEWDRPAPAFRTPAEASEWAKDQRAQNLVEFHKKLDSGEIRGCDHCGEVTPGNDPCQHCGY